ncbi:MAG: carbamoyltransferase HypF [Vicinamibacteria bacterium]
MAPPAGRRISIRGVVQGVGFRPFVYRLARESGIAGRVYNDAAGVTIEAFAPRGALEVFLERLRAEAPAAAQIRALVCQEIAAPAPSGFSIDGSAAAAARRVSIPADLATCPECLAEIRDPKARRHRYAFTNCTRCGPRFTIARDVPYDRAATTMAGFEMCAECRAEYESVADRRFHAQPIACPACGPRLALVSPAGTRIEVEDEIRAAARALAGGSIVALKGIGGFHLACDARSEAAVSRLRERKRRDEKPFAVMVAELPQAEALAVLSDAERQLLVSVERPIVLARRRVPSPLARAVAPDNPLVGLLLAYAPLHHLLLDEVGAPLVMTSGNLSEEPLAWRNDEALARLGGIADLLLVHDREIEAPCDDSVARVIAGVPTLLRRARGHVPRALPFERRFARPVLACGAHLKNTFCVGSGDEAQLGPHVGDLENLATEDAYRAAIERQLRFLRVRPELVAYDLHPGYLSTRYALERPEPVKIGVQHHHAHVASLLAEHGLPGPILGVAYDGTGFGTDGTLWGGEILLATLEGYERVASFRSLALPGGERAIREVWRTALALLDDAYAGDPPLGRLPLFASVPPAEIAVVRQMQAQGLNCPRARGVGRYFDAFGALGLGRARSAHEGQIALLWNLAADPCETQRYDYRLDVQATPCEIDLRPAVRQAVDDLVACRGAGVVSARFHRTLAAATAEAVRLVAERVGRLAVGLSGGCFQNPLLVEQVVAALGSDFVVLRHRQAPPGDGGIALGQAVVADAVARKSL